MQELCKTIKTLDCKQINFSQMFETIKLFVNIVNSFKKKTKKR